MDKIRIILLLAVTIFASACSSVERNGRLIIQGRRSEASIRKLLLTKTPIGDNATDVALFINQHLQHLGGDIPGTTLFNGEKIHKMFDLAPSDGRYTRAYFKSIPDYPKDFDADRPRDKFYFKIILGEYRTIYVVMPIATWHFDADGILKDITVTKELDGP